VGKFLHQTNVFVDEEEVANYWVRGHASCAREWCLARRYVQLAALCAGWRCGLEQLTDCATALEKCGIAGTVVPTVEWIQRGWGGGNIQIMKNPRTVFLTIAREQQQQTQLLYSCGREGQVLFSLSLVNLLFILFYFTLFLYDKSSLDLTTNRDGNLIP